MTHSSLEGYSIDCTAAMKSEASYTAYGVCWDKSDDSTVCSFSEADCTSGEVFKDPFNTSASFSSVDCGCCKWAGSYDATTWWW